MRFRQYCGIRGKSRTNRLPLFRTVNKPVTISFTDRSVSPPSPIRVLAFLNSTSTQPYEDSQFVTQSKPYMSYITSIHTDRRTSESRHVSHLTHRPGQSVSIESQERRVRLSPEHTPGGRHGGRDVAVGSRGSVRTSPRLSLKPIAITMPCSEHMHPPDSNDLYVFRRASPSPPASTRLKKFTGRQPRLIQFKSRYRSLFDGTLPHPTNEQTGVLNPSLRTPCSPVPVIQPMRPIQLLAVLPTPRPLQDLASML